MVDAMTKGGTYLLFKLDIKTVSLKSLGRFKRFGVTRAGSWPGLRNLEAAQLQHNAMLSYAKIQAVGPNYYPPARRHDAVVKRSNTPMLPVPVTSLTVASETLHICFRTNRPHMGCIG